MRLVKQSDRTMAELAMELGISAMSIGEWVRLSEESGDPISDDEQLELRRLRKENRELRMEMEILAKATTSSENVPWRRVSARTPNTRRELTCLKKPVQMKR